MDLRLRLFFLLLVALVAAAVWTFPAWRHVVQPLSVTGGFPGLELDLQDEYLALPREQREELLALHAEDADKALDMARIAISEPELAPPDDGGDAAQQARALVSGAFIQINALHWGAGTATIYQLGAGAAHPATDGLHCGARRRHAPLPLA